MVKDGPGKAYDFGAPTPKPRIFIASSVEGKDLADALEIALQNDGHCTAWHEAFPLSNNTLETLLRRCAENDFAIFIVSPDDRAEIRNRSFEIARDNVLFESGLFMGLHGRERGFVITPQSNPSFQLPTDFLGFTIATYDHERAKRETGPALGAAAALIRQAIKNSSWSRQRLQIKTRAASDASATWKLKLYVEFKNIDGIAVAVESDGFAPAADVPIDPNERLRAGEKYPFRFHMGRRQTAKQTNTRRSVWCFRGTR